MADFMLYLNPKTLESKNNDPQTKEGNNKYMFSFYPKFSFLSLPGMVDTNFLRFPYLFQEPFKNH